MQLKRILSSRLSLALFTSVTALWPVLLAAQSPSVSASVEEYNGQSRASIANQSSGRATAAPDDLFNAKVAPGFLLSLSVFGVPEYSDLPPLRVDADGNIHISGLDPIHVSGLTIAEAETVVTKAFIDQQVLVNPLVRLSVEEYLAAGVTVLGEVQSPGRYPILAPRDLTDVLARAGGLTEASAGEIEIEHTGASGVASSRHVAFRQRDSLEKLRGIEISPGDTVYVRRAGIVYVMGAVNKSGGFIMIDGGKLSVYQALALAGGMQLDAGGGGLLIIRPQADGTFQQIKMPFSKIARGTQDAISLQENDVLFVPRSGLKVTLLDGAGIVGSALNGALYTLR